MIAKILVVVENAEVFVAGILSSLTELPLPAETVDPADIVARLMADSEFLKSIAAAQATTHESRGLRALGSEEIQVLKEQHNAAEDWSRVWVGQAFNPHKVVGCYFSGDVALGTFKERIEIEPGVTIGSGVYNCDLKNVSIGDNAYVSNNTLIANYYVGPNAIVEGCGSVICTGKTAFGNGQRVSLGIEAGGRETAFFAELSVELAARIASFRKSRGIIEAYELAVEQYTRAATSRLGVIDARAVVKNTPKIFNTYIGSGAVIDSATSLENTSVLSNVAESTRVASGACVRDSLVQWGSIVETHALVQQSVLCESSGVDSHGKVTRSLIGSNTTVSCGECIHSLLGPFVGFHHQALLISAFWPEGKGNLGYGANVGSNHTSKAPDQEIWPGEGTFFGMGVNIKFPTDLTRSPYSIIATGISSLPQRCGMPFSLINVRAEHIQGVSPAYNEILPGWVLSDNIYAVLRNERKYAIRNKATRSQFSYEVFRPEVVDCMLSARTALQSVESKPDSETNILGAGHGLLGTVYTDKDIPALGKNFMKETARLEGIKAYTFYIRLYALRGLRLALRFCVKTNRDHSRVLESDFIGDPRYEHERKVLLSEFPGMSIPKMLFQLAQMSETMCKEIRVSKEKDDFRGTRIIPDYVLAHVPAAQDAFVVTAQRESEELKAEIEQMLKRF